MTWHETDDVEQWLAAVGDLLFHEPGRYTLALTQAQRIRDGDEGTRLAWWWDGTDVTGAALWRSPFPPVVCVCPSEAFTDLVALWSLSQASGETEVLTTCFDAAGLSPTWSLRQRLHRLTDLVPPDVPGLGRQATEADTDTVISLFRSFLAEANAPGLDPAVEVPRRIARGMITLWDHDGAVALAGRQPEAFGGARIGPVYTPPRHRGRGYAAAATATTTALAAVEAHEVVLYTDAANAVAERVYARLGFVPIGERAVASW
jgi:ribosomal protein S18 acetylase RimI-like enzyme